MLTQLVLVFLLESIAIAEAQVRDRLHAEWTTLANAHKTSGHWKISMRGRSHDGNWMIRLGGWSYFFRDAELRCRQQGDDYMTCGTQDFVALADARVEIRAGSQPAITLARLRSWHRAIWGPTLAIDDRGRATVETIVSTPAAERRTSRRYRVGVTFTPQGFKLERSQLVEEYQERCRAIHGCHSTHWSCQRI